MRRLCSLCSIPTENGVNKKVKSFCSWLYKTNRFAYVFKSMMSCNYPSASSGRQRLQRHKRSLSRWACRNLSYNLYTTIFKKSQKLLLLTL
jgi:hypothetical protein